MLIFVYGTLMSGFNNNAYLSRAEFKGRAETKEKYGLFARGIPFLSDRHKISKVQGELYEVSTDQLRAIDTLEGHPAWYKRTPIIVLNDAKEEVRAQAYIYLKNLTGSKIVNSGNYRDYAKKVFEGPVQTPIT